MKDEISTSQLEKRRAPWKQLLLAGVFLLVASHKCRLTSVKCQGTVSRLQSTCRFHKL